jgi:hypothetical protein
LYISHLSIARVSQVCFSEGMKLSPLHVLVEDAEQLLDVARLRVTAISIVEVFLRDNYI